MKDSAWRDCLLNAMVAQNLTGLFRLVETRASGRLKGDWSSLQLPLCVLIYEARSFFIRFLFLSASLEGFLEAGVSVARVLRRASRSS